VRFRFSSLTSSRTIGRRKCSCHGARSIISPVSRRPSHQPAMRLLQPSQSCAPSRSFCSKKRPLPRGREGQFASDKMGGSEAIHRLRGVQRQSTNRNMKRAAWAILTIDHERRNGLASANVSRTLDGMCRAISASARVATSRLRPCTACIKSTVEILRTSERCSRGYSAPDAVNRLQTAPEACGRRSCATLPFEATPT
jgi:hypothetical protein